MSSKSENVQISETAKKFIAGLPPYRTNSLYFESDCWVDADQAFHAEEAECAGMYLTKLGVPKHNNDGEKLSLVGRIQMAMVMFPPKTYKPND